MALVASTPSFKGHLVPIMNTNREKYLTKNGLGFQLTGVGTLEFYETGFDY